MSTSGRLPAPVIADGLVGRERELDALSVRLDLARDGAGRLLVTRVDSEPPDEPLRVFEAVTDSLLVLRHLADRLAASRLLVVATLRDVALAEAFPRVLADLMRSPGTDCFVAPRG